MAVASLRWCLDGERCFACGDLRWLCLGPGFECRSSGPFGAGCSPRQALVPREGEKLLDMGFGPLRPIGNGGFRKSAAAATPVLAHPAA